MVDSKFTAFFEATTLGNFEAKTTRDHYVASVRIGSEVRKADVPNDTNFRFGTLAESMIDVWVETVSPGMADLAERMIAASGAELHLETPVIAITQDVDGVRWAISIQCENMEPNGASCFCVIRYCPGTSRMV